jgi:hypothetical protein
MDENSAQKPGVLSLRAEKALERLRGRHPIRLAHPGLGRQNRMAAFLQVGQN